MSWSQQRWQIIWDAVRDVALTGTGIILILTQVWAKSPSDVLITAGLALTIPSVAGHAKILLSSGSSGLAAPSSPSTPPSGPSPSGSSSGGTDEGP